jgi:hypothetical protein
MARIDKVTMIVRALAGTALTGIIGVYFPAGSVMPAGTAAGSEAKGIICEPGTIAAGQAIGVLKKGEIVEFSGTVGGTYYSGVGGTLSTTSTNATKVGVTVEADRLIVDL